MIILVSMRTAENGTYPESRDAVSHDWILLFARYGLTPILVPNMLGDVSDYFKLGASGLLLTGGDDLGPDGEPSPRDQTEARLLGERWRRVCRFSVHAAACTCSTAISAVNWRENSPKITSAITQFALMEQASSASTAFTIRVFSPVVLPQSLHHSRSRIPAWSKP